MRVAVLAFVVFSSAVYADLNDPPPRAALITVSAPDANGDVSITGASGSVTPQSTVVCLTMDTGHYAAVTSTSAGAFSVPKLYAPEGTYVLVKVDPNARPFDEHGFGLVQMAGTILRVPGDPARFTGVSVVPASLTVPWRFDGTVTFTPPGPMIVRGTIIIDSPVADMATITVMPRLLIERLTLADGSHMLPQSSFASAFVTPTGFPIERTPWPMWSSQAQPVTLQRTAPGRAEGTIEVRLTPPALGDGLYRPVLWPDITGVPADVQPARPMLFDLKAVDRASRKTGKNSIAGPLIRIGAPAPPRMNWMLLANDLSEGTRGVRAIEDRRRFGFAPRVATQSEMLVVPRGRYRIEPFAPGMSLGDREVPSAPSIPFRFPSGSLRAEVTHPDGRVIAIAPLPFVQSRSINLTTPGGFALDSGGGYPHDPYQLSTMDSSFELAFETFGKYVIRLEGFIDDVWGNRWSGSGTYEVMVARPLVLDTTVLPGTPFEVGDVLSGDVQLIPPVAADVDVTVELDGVVQTLRGRANRFGRFHIAGVPWTKAGEYRVDVTATYRDENGELWAGARTWGSVVAPRDAPLVAHGNRGIDDMQEPRPIWFRRTTPTGSGHIQIPFLGGDVMWETDDDAAIPHITWDDPGKLLASVIARLGLTPRRYDEGWMPPVLASTRGVEPHLAPEAVDFVSYAYRSVQRPLVRVREIVGEESGIAGYYWRFNSAYGGQRGVGCYGDLPNDFKFQFGGLVVRGAAVGTPQYAIYGSLFVLVPQNDPAGGSRVFPPFRGNGGGPDGGPLFRLKGQEVDLFFHPTGIRPGSIVHRGEIVSLAGYSAPTLPSKITAVFTSPSGETHTIGGQANLIGWFHDPRQDFVAGESGVWKAKVAILFDGATSAGQVTAPYPAGNVLGSREGQFYFYVVDNTSPALAVDDMAPTVRPADGPITFRVRPPAGLKDVQLTYTVTMPGFILEEGATTSTRYTYDSQKLALTFPNLDLTDGDNRAGVDTITISLLASGTDASGKRQHLARQVVIQGEEIQMPAQMPRPKRRSSR